MVFLIIFTKIKTFSMKKIFTPIVLFAILLLGYNKVVAQNLVPNNGFEIQDTCPAVSQITLAPPWNSATSGTPDLFNSTCGSQNSAARTGIGSSGLYLYSTFPNNREYMQAPLTSPLVGGQTYCVSFYVIRANFRYAINRVGAYFSVGSVSQATTSTLSFTPQVQNPPSTMLSNSGWILVTGSFTASGGEDHIIIGNFSNDANTDTLVVNAASSSKVAIYRFDDISVTTCANNGVNDLTETSNNISVYPVPANNYISVLAENGSSFSNYQLFNTSGQIVKSEGMNGMSTNLYLEINDLADGIYFLKLDTPAGIVNKKIQIIR